jgi:hypothetical protein
MHAGFMTLTTVSACGLMMKCCGHNEINTGKNKFRKKKSKNFPDWKK